MADRLTQLQDCLDDLATQMFASLRYVQTRHPWATIPGQPDMNPHSSANSTNTKSEPSQTANGTATVNSTQLPDPSNTEEPVPDGPEVFQAALRELARDLIMKEQQIEHLIGVLPGIGTSEKDQNDRIQELEAELRQVEEQRKIAMQEKEEMLDVLGDLAMQCKRVY